MVARGHEGKYLYYQLHTKNDAREKSENPLLGAAARGIKARCG
jgi:hypothetical protein